MNETYTRVTPEIIRVGQIEIRYVQAADNTCEMGCFELRVPPDSNVPPPHSHSGNEELVYVLEGTLRYTVGSKTRDLRPGDSMATPRGMVHAFSNPHAVVARALVINTPDIGPSYFREVASIINVGGAARPSRALSNNAALRVSAAGSTPGRITALTAASPPPAVTASTARGHCPGAVVRARCAGRSQSVRCRAAPRLMR
jgi:mannose-6-phosphate isomerase-like protein (cupin superfamily)